MPEDSPVDIDFIRQLAQIIADGAVGEIEIKHDDVKIRLSRETVGGGVAAAAQVSMPAPHLMPQPMPAFAPPPGAATATTAGEAVGDVGEAVPSPMVGTAYMAAAPGAEPYARVGEKVSKGQTIMIVEAMKTMNQIPSPRDGTVRAICVEDGQPVEYGETLVMLD